MMNNNENINAARNLRSRPKVDRRLSRKRQTAPITGTREREKVKYAFIGLSGTAGATTLAFAFAEYLASLRLAERPMKKKGMATDYAAAVVEINDNNRPSCGFDYDRIGVDKHFAGREYISFYRLLSRGRPIRGLANFDGGVNWILRMPGEEFERFDIVDFIRLIDNAAGDAVICDVNGSFGLTLERDEDRIAELRKMLDDMDRVCVVVDPLPSGMMADCEKIEMFKDYEAAGGDIVYIVNKLNPGVNIREMKSFLRVRDAIEIPYFSPVDVYTAEYNCCTVFTMPDIAKQLAEPFEKIRRLHSFPTSL
ncbi:MAG: hypothetical protein LBQ21_07095 [Clostridiales Family XIII bacterium]|nr:hypothetical protein [Clostridiales Family XIII bacterium]